MAAGTAQAPGTGAPAARSLSPIVSLGPGDPRSGPACLFASPCGGSAEPEPTPCHRPGAGPWGPNPRRGLAGSRRAPRVQGPPAHLPCRPLQALDALLEAAAGGLHLSVIFCSVKDPVLGPGCPHGRLSREAPPSRGTPEAPGCSSLFSPTGRVLAPCPAGHCPLIHSRNGPADPVHAWRGGPQAPC